MFGQIAGLDCWVGAAEWNRGRKAKVLTLGRADPRDTQSHTMYRRRAGAVERMYRASIHTPVWERSCRAIHGWHWPRVSSLLLALSAVDATRSGGVRCRPWGRIARGPDSGGELRAQLGGVPRQVTPLAAVGGLGRWPSLVLCVCVYGRAKDHYSSEYDNVEKDVETWKSKVLR